MARSSRTAIFVVVMAAGILDPALLWAQDTSGFAGRWTLNRGLSEFPPAIGYGVIPTDGSGLGTPTSGGRGRRGSGGGRAGTLPESADEAKRMEQLTAEVRDPSAHLTIVETPTTVIVTNDRGQSRTFHPTGKEDVLPLDGVPVGVTAKWDAGRLVVLYSVEQGRDLRYTYAYSRAANPPQLVVDVQFIERGGGDRVRRIYEPASATETSTAGNVTPAPATTPQGVGSTGTGAASRTGGVPASAGGLPAQTFNSQPDAELKGLTKFEIVVEDLSPQAVACGLSQGALETVVSSRLSAAGFTVLRNSNKDDPYVYINVITTSLSNGLCVSRYDVFLYTYTIAKLAYQETPVLAQVSLLHKGGLAGGASAVHAEAVLRGVQEYVDQFSARIRDANK